MDVAECLQVAGASPVAAASAPARPRLALATIHDLQIPFEGADDRAFRRYLRPAHASFYEQASLRLLRESYALEHVLLVPLERLAKHPLQPATRASMAEQGVRIVEVPWIHPPLTESVVRETEADPQTFGPGEFIRIHLWNLTEYEAVLYIDHDMLILGDVTPLLACSRATGLYLTTSGPAAPLNMGLHALRPDRGVFEALTEVLTASEYDPETGFTAVPGRNTWGVVDGAGLSRGSAHAGLQGFLYYFFYRADEVVHSALLRRHASARAAQVHRCLWNYIKEHLMFRYKTDQALDVLPGSEKELLFRCPLGAAGLPKIVHKLDQAMQHFLLRNRSEWQAA